MVKKTFLRLLPLLLALLVLPVLAMAAPAVVDDAHLFTGEEIQKLEAVIEQIRNDYQMDAVVMTTNDIPQGSDYATQLWTDNYYDSNGYGVGEDRAGMLFLIDMNNRLPCISTTGALADYITDDRLDDLFDSMDAPLRQGAYGSAALSTLTKLQSFLQKGRVEGSFRYDRETGKRLSGVYNPLTTTELLIALVAGLIVALIYIRSTVSTYTLAGTTYNYNAAAESEAQIRVDHGTYLRDKVVHMPRSTGSSGHSSGSSRPGGGSGVSMHSGGSHGGGTGRHF